MSTPPEPWGSGVVEIATRRVLPPSSVGLAQAHLQWRSPRPWENSLPPGLVQSRSALPTVLPVREFGPVLHNQFAKMCWSVCEDVLSWNGNILKVSGFYGPSTLTATYGCHKQVAVGKTHGLLD